MANFDFLKKQAAKAMNKVSQVAEVAVEKGSEVAEIGKLKIKISSQERKIEDLYFQIGKAFYESCAESGSYPDFVAEQCQAITACLEEIEELKGKIEWTKGGSVEEDSSGFSVPEEEVVVTAMEPVVEEESQKKDEAEVAAADTEEEGDDFSGIEIPVEPTPAKTPSVEEKSPDEINQEIKE